MKLSPNRPTREQLEKLPKRALVAYAVRAAWRVQLWTKGRLPEETLRNVIVALAAAMHFSLRKNNVDTQLKAVTAAIKPIYNVPYGSDYSSYKASAAIAAADAVGSIFYDRPNSAYDAEYYTGLGWELTDGNEDSVPVAYEAGPEAFSDIEWLTQWSHSALKDATVPIEYFQRPLWENTNATINIQDLTVWAEAHQKIGLGIVQEIYEALWEGRFTQQHQLELDTLLINWLENYSDNEEIMDKGQKEKQKGNRATEPMAFDREEPTFQETSTILGAFINDQMNVNGPEESPHAMNRQVRSKKSGFDVFICHASEDKDDFVRPLANALRNRNIEVWYDEFTLKWGDGLRQSIDKGLSSSLYGIIVLSESFFRKEWPQRELDGLSALEMDGKKRILPIWHDIDVVGVRNASPTLANLVSMSSTDGVDVVAEKFVALLRDSA